jgi:hypothetical protein
MTAEQIAALLQATRFQFSSEDDLQRGIDALLRSKGIVAKREVVLGPGDRIDFLIEGGIGIEVKVRGSASTLGRQVERYLSGNRLSSIIVVTSRMEHQALPSTISSKTVLVVHLLASVF